MKRNYWPVFFIGIFSFTFAMIIWTIVSSTKVNIEEDKSFFKKYQDVDDNFNNIMLSNKAFLEKYNVEVVLNKKVFGLETEDIMYSQRVLEKRKRHRDLINIGKNSLTINIIDKQTNEQQKVDIKLKVTMSNTMKNDVILLTENFENANNSYKTIFDIKNENNWNITGTFKVGDNIGYIYIKTNAI